MRVAGFGFRAGARIASLEAALARAGGAAGLDALATAEDKAAIGPLKKLSVRLGLPLLSIAVDQIATADVALSLRAPPRYGGRSLAEAAALIAAGPGGRLIVPRVVSADGMATVAIAEGPGT